MLCRMCLSESLDIINIFEETGTKLKISSVITRHFWFEPKNDDPISTIICNSCWLKISDFHEYYTSVEEAQQNLSNLHLISTVKEENNDNNIEENQLIDRDDNGEPGYTHEDPFCNENNDTNSVIADESKPLNLVDENIVLSNELKNENEYMFACALTEDKENYENCLNEQKGINENYKDNNLDNANRNEVLEDEIIEEERNQVRKLRVRKLRKSSRSSIKRKIKTVSEKNEDLNEMKTKRKRGTLKIKERLKSVNEKRNSEYVLKSKAKDEEIARYMKLKCELCPVEYDTFAQLGQHCREVHEEKPYIICCNKKLFRKNLILDHIKRHLNPDHFKCGSCEKSFASKESLKNHHLVVHRSNEEKGHKCPECPKRFAKRYQLNHHLLIHGSSKEHICDQCGRKFPSRNTMLTHKKNVHEGAYSHMCDICAKVIRNKTLFTKHMKEHMGIVEEEVQCDECGAKLKNFNSLRKHKRRHEEAKTTQTCPICGKIAPTRGAVLSHIRYVHSAQRSHQCSICSKAFKTPVGLREHMSTHTGEVLYSCPHCSKTFNSSANLHSHRKKAHRQEWEEARRKRKFLHIGENIGYPTNSTPELQNEGSADEEENNKSNEYIIGI